MLGVPVRSTLFIGIVLAVVLTAAWVTLAGPIGFVGLCAPVIVRLLGRVVPALNRHTVLIPVCGPVGALAAGRPHRSVGGGHGCHPRPALSPRFNG